MCYLTDDVYLLLRGTLLVAFRFAALVPGLAVRRRAACGEPRLRPLRLPRMPA